jgi:hypothetical protein
MRNLRAIKLTIMKKTFSATLFTLFISLASIAQVTIGNRPIVVKPVTVGQEASLTLPTLQDTLKMLMMKVKELEEQKLSGGKKTIKVITPNASNMCFPYNNSKYPNQAFFQGVVVDDAICNNNPNAVLMVTVKTTQPMQAFPVSISYDASDGKWKISLQGYLVSSLAKNVQCYNFNGKDQTMCPPSGLYHDIGVMNAVTLSPNYDNKIEFNVLISERADVKLPKIRKIGG